MRIAWIGPTPTDGTGVPYAATQLVRGLADAGADVDVFTAGRPPDLSASLLGRQGVRVYLTQPKWIWDGLIGRFYMSGYIADQTARSVAQTHAVARMIDLHRQRRYDVVYQFSQPEPIPSERQRRSLPPYVIHPQAHACGELRALWTERRTVLGCESWARAGTAAAMMATRAVRQRRQLPTVDLVLTPSEAFGAALTADCGVPKDRRAVVPNPVDLERYRPARERPPSGPVRLLFVSYLAVRKGVELIVGLSHRLADLAGRVQVHVAGGGRPWSDLSILLDRARPEILVREGLLDGVALVELYRSGHALLAPSRYEPFGLSVAEALASGMPVVASESVGALEHVAGPAIRTFPPDDLDSFEAVVRQLVGEIETGTSFSEDARTQAQAFGEAAVGRALLRALERVA